MYSAEAFWENLSRKIRTNSLSAAAIIQSTSNWQCWTEWKCWKSERRKKNRWSKAKQNKTKQNKIKQNKIKQNKTKQKKEQLFLDSCYADDDWFYNCNDIRIIRNKNWKMFDIWW